MEPTLPAGSVVWVDHGSRAAEPGDVILIEGSQSPIIHRVVHHAGSGNSSLVYHRGDFEGGIGIAAGSAVLGTVVAVMRPERAPVLGLADLPSAFQRRFRIARLRCRADAFSRRLAAGFGLDRLPWFRSLGRAVRDRLL
jgi:hypothetical protein